MLTSSEDDVPNNPMISYSASALKTSTSFQHHCTGAKFLAHEHLGEHQTHNKTTAMDMSINETELKSPET